MGGGRWVAWLGGWVSGRILPVAEHDTGRDGDGRGDGERDGAGVDAEVMVKCLCLVRCELWGGGGVGCIVTRGQNKAAALIIVNPDWKNMDYRNYSIEE